MKTPLINLFNQLSSAHWTGLTRKNTRRWHFYARNGKFEHFNEVFSSGHRLEVFFEGAMGYASTASEDNLMQAQAQALSLAKLSSDHKLFHFEIDHIRPASRGEWTAGVDFQLSDENRKQLVEYCTQTSIHLSKGKDIRSSQCHLYLEEIETEMINSSGAHTFQRHVNMMDATVATAANSSDSQTRSNGTMVGQKNLFSNWEAQKERIERIREEARELLLASNCPDERLPLLIAPDQLYLQIHESIGHPLELDRILGDERNYAGWSFLSPEDFGRLQYGSKLLNITFDPSVEGELASYAFDEAGVPAKREYLIKEGKLLRSIGSIESQVRSGVPGVANFRSTDWNRAPIDRMANINMEPGQSSLEEMIGSVENGIFMQTNRSWSIDDYRNKFQFGCEYGRMIRKGKLAEVVRNPNYRGKCLEFWNNLAMVGNQETFQIHGSFYCGKGEPNQIIRVGHATPFALFNNVEVFGGA